MVSHKAKHTLTIRSSNHAPWYRPKGEENISTQNPALWQRWEGGPLVLASLTFSSLSVAPPYTFALNILSACVLNFIIKSL